MINLYFKFIYRCRFYSIAIFLLLLIGCASSGRYAPAPIEDRQKSKTVQNKTPVQVATVGKATSSQLPIINEPPPKSAYYVVKPGDTLIRIGLEHGQNWRDIIRWNSIENPNLIDVGQVLRVVPPQIEQTVDPISVKPFNAQSPIINGGTETKPVVQAVIPQSPANVENNEESTVFTWPAAGNLIAVFDDLKNKGIDIAGKMGEPVFAAADGRVVYAGSGLRGYGNLVIVKHANNYLTAYAHNQNLLVKEDQSVKRGQKIAEMGNTDSDIVKLHFEIRKQGKPADPVKLLPIR